MRAAMKSGQKLRLETLRTLRAHLIELTKRGSEKPVSSEDELSAVMTAIKKRKEAIDLYQQAGRKELVDREKQELAILQEYLPRQLSREEVREVINNIIRTTEASSPDDFGRIMGIAMKELRGKADGKIVREIVRQNLGQTANDH